MPDNKNALPLGTILNTRYKIEGLVGGGGFGLVYKAKHLKLDSIVAIKELFPGDIVVRQDKAVYPTSDDKVALYQKVLSGFRKEGQRLARLGNCPSIVRCHDYFEENSTGYLVMEYVEGKSLRELVRTYRKAGKSFSEDALVSLLKKLLAGLKEVHKAGIQHMDIKPENIYLWETENLGELSSPVLLDFGAARSQTGHSTGSSLLVGTVPYAPLEQMYEGGVIGPWTDIYALGITLYELIFEGANIPGSTERVSEFHGKGIDPLEAAKSKGKPGYSEKFLELIDKSIEIKAEDRPQSVEELEEKLSLSEKMGHPPKFGDKEENQKQVVETFRDCTTCPEMVVVPSGSFMMGSPADESNRDDDEGPQHQVSIQSFAVGKYEVTVGQFEEFVNETRHQSSEWRNPGFKQSANHPVVNVSWEDAKAYTEWLSTKTGQNYRLLSEAEWEYVARAVTTTPYNFDATISRSQANYRYDGREFPDDGGTVEVGSYPANAFGLHDFHGNVLEWVGDCWYDNYNRFRRYAIYRSNYFGFRIARTFSPLSTVQSSISTSESSEYQGKQKRDKQETGSKKVKRIVIKLLILSVLVGSGLYLYEEAARQAQMEAELEAARQAKLAAERQALLAGKRANKVGESFLDCATCPAMVIVPAGSFMMGSQADERGRYDNEGPQYQVTISEPFAVSKYEVTVGQFEEFINETEYSDNEWRKPDFKQSANHPVVDVSWEDAKVYTEWLSKKTGQNYRLLSEVEWEYAARAGTTTAYHFGAMISPTQANYGDNNDGTVVVGSYPANAFGLHDVHGNVWEWVEDCWHDVYNDAPSDGRAWTINCDKDMRVLRGGAWNFNPRILRSALRDRSYAWYRDSDVGFRIARTLASKVGDTGSEEIEHSPKSENKEENQKQIVNTFRDCAICPEMVVVPSGSFMMGSPANEPGRYDNEGPQHRVTISKPFAVGKYEVTVGQFEEFTNETGHPSNQWRDPSFEQSANHPVVNVNWEDAKAYTEWLSTKTGQNYRLLSEAEWEYVARAGTTTAYHFGTTISPNQTNYDKANQGTVEVGSYPANAFGLHDVHGNVWEWVEDCWHNDYNGAPSDGSAWTSDCIYDGEMSVLRGGSWFDYPGGLRSALRFWTGIWFHNSFDGFRIARDLTP